MALSSIDCCIAMDKLIELLGYDDVVSNIQKYFSNDDITDFIENTAKMYDLEDHFPEIFYKEDEDEE